MKILLPTYTLALLIHPIHTLCLFVFYFFLGFLPFQKMDSSLIECLESKSLFDSHCRLDVQQSLLRNTVIFT